MNGCLITGCRTQYGNNVSHAKNRTGRLFLSNIFSKYIFSEVMGKVKVRISHRGERTVDKYGGLDQFLLNAKNRRLTLDAKSMKSKLHRRMKKLGQPIEDKKSIVKYEKRQSQRIIKKLSASANS